MDSIGISWLDSRLQVCFDCKLQFGLDVLKFLSSGISSSPEHVLVMILTEAQEAKPNHLTTDLYFTELVTSHLYCAHICIAHS